MKKNELKVIILKNDDPLKGMVLKVTGQSYHAVTVEYGEECFSFTKTECAPFINRQQISWSAFELSKEQVNEF